MSHHHQTSCQRTAVRSRRNWHSAALASAAAIFAIAGTAQAQTLGVRFLGTNKGSALTVTSPTTNGNFFAGQLSHALSNPLGGTPVDLVGTRNTFCIELAQFVSSSVITYAYLDTNSGSIYTGIQPYDSRITAAVWMFSRFGQVASNTTNNDVAAAMQLALWEVMTDWDPVLGRSSLSIDSGAFSATKTNSNAINGALLTQVNLYLDGAVPGIGLPQNVAVLASNTAQDQITFVPTPGAGLIAAAGAAVLLGRRKRHV